MVRKSNSFVVTKIKDYERKMDLINNEKVIEKGRKGKLKKKTKSVISVKSSDFKNSESKLKTKTNDDRKETTNGSFPATKPFKTNNFLKKCFESRREKGMILLSPKVEQKIYKLKKSLRKKGLEESMIIDIIRKRRREEEIKYSKEANKCCFKCRQIGHMIADCPLNSKDDGVDICYRCGSSEHKLSECGQNSEELPFAKCFLCRQVGHLTRDCTQNSRGVYPKGGECKACHSVNHLIKDCPQNQKEKELENEITLSLFEANHSIDAEVVDHLMPVKREDNTKKVIKF